MKGASFYSLYLTVSTYSFLSCLVSELNSIELPFSIKFNSNFYV